MRILITNDDGYFSPGLHLLYESVKDLGEVLVIAPEVPKSAVGFSITLHKPLRLYRTQLNGIDIWVTNGTPSDALYLAINKLGFIPDIVLSGINVGDNTSIQNILLSGTLAAGIAAALMGIKAIAFSADVDKADDFKNSDVRSMIMPVIRIVIEYVIQRFKNTSFDLLSVNFPKASRFRKCIRVVRACRVRWIQKIEERIDPRGKPYYWLYGVEAKALPNTDVYAVHVEGCIAITPITIDVNAVPYVLDDITHYLSKKNIRW